MCKCLFKTLFSTLYDLYPEMGLLDYMVFLFLVFEEPVHVFHRGCTILHSHQQCTTVLFSPHLHQRLLSSGFCVCVFVCLFVLDSAHPNRCELIALCGFDLEFSDD